MIALFRESRVQKGHVETYAAVNRHLSIIPSTRIISAVAIGQEAVLGITHDVFEQRFSGQGARVRLLNGIDMPVEVRHIRRPLVAEGLAAGQTWPGGV